MKHDLFWWKNWEKFLQDSAERCRIIPVKFHSKNNYGDSTVSFYLGFRNINGILIGSSVEIEVNRWVKWKLLFLGRSIEKSIRSLILTCVFRRFLIYFDPTRGGPSLRRICEFREGNMPGGIALRELEIGRTMESETMLSRREKSKRNSIAISWKVTRPAFERSERQNRETRILNIQDVQ